MNEDKVKGKHKWQKQHNNRTQQKLLLRIVFRENYGYSNEYQSVDIRVLLDQHVQCINNYNVLAQTPETQYVEFV